MEASQEQGQDPNQADVDNGSQDQQAADSQQSAQDDSQLQTTQPDQPVPTPEPEAQPQSEAPEPGPQSEVGPSGQPAEGQTTAPSYPSGAEQQAAEDQRQADLHAQRQEHNDRTGGGPVNEGEVQAQRDVHNERTAAGVPRPTEAEVQAQDDQTQPQDDQS